MSQQLINRSPDLKRLRDEGYEVEIRSNFLLLKNIPYLNSRKEVKYGILISELTLAGNKTCAPSTHVAMFAGEHPCNANGSEMSKIKHGSSNNKIDDTLVASHSFSSKPVGGYKDYYDKMTTYANIIISQALHLKPDATARTFAVIAADADASVFNYHDTASSRADITAITKKLEIPKIGIIGLGGTGAYILDLISKTPVGEIHLFDGDRLFQHNAFRYPGAASVEELEKMPFKVEYLKEKYSKMHRRIFAHPKFIDATNVDCLNELNFAFVSIDKGLAKKPILEKLETLGIDYIDVGMGLQIVDDSLIGVVRTTSSTNKKRDHVRDKNRIALNGADLDDVYSQNIQVADLNAFNAAWAVLKWKKMRGFYADLENEHHATYTLDGNLIINDDQT